MQLRSDKAFLVTRTRDTEKSMINATIRERRFENAFRIAIWLWVLKRVSKEETTAKVRSDTHLSQKHVSVEMINAKLFWNALQCVPEKNRTLKQWKKVVRCVTIINISWSMINMLSNDTYLKFQFMLHWAALFSKLNVKSHLCHFQVHVGRGIVIITVQCGLA